MKLKASLMFAYSLIFPKAEKKSSARRSLMGALLCIGLSIVPLVVVLTVTNGMIEGMTERLIGLSSSHLEALVARNSRNIVSSKAFQNFADEIKKAEGVTNAYPQVSLTALAGGKKERAGAQVRAVPADIFVTNKAFSSLFTVCDGDLSDFFSGVKNAVVGQKLAETLNIVLEILSVLLQQRREITELLLPNLPLSRFPQLSVQVIRNWTPSGSLFPSMWPMIQFL